MNKFVHLNTVGSVATKHTGAIEEEEKGNITQSILV